jgi:glycerol uptake facilitator-like aquaporin
MQIDSELLRATCGELFGSFLFLWLSLSTISLFGDDPLSIAFGFGISIAVLVYCLAEISGGHLNFAVTFGFLIAKEIDYIRALLYLAAQLLGSTLGALAAIKGLGVADSEPDRMLCEAGNMFPVGFITEEKQQQLKETLKNLFDSWRK